MRAIGIIPARLESTRLQRKMLCDVAGKPLIQRTYENALKSNKLSDLIVATDSSEIMSAVKDFGGKAVLTDAKHQSGTDRIAEAVQNLDCDIVINIQGDEPCLDTAHIQSLIHCFDDPECPMATLAHPILEDEAMSVHNVKVVLNQNNNALYFSRAPIPYPRDNTYHIYYKHVGVYAYRKSFLLQYVQWPPSPLEHTEHLEQLRVLEHGYTIKVVIFEDDTIGVDTEDDLNQIRTYFEENDQDA